MPRIKITLNNEAGELDSKTVTVPDTDAGAEIVKTAVAEIVDSVAYFSPGDSITIEEC